MFQTNINQFLQSFSAPWLDAFVKSISWAGDQTFVVGVLCLIVLGIDFRRGFLLLQLVLLTIISTDVAKTLLSLPRPFFVDASLNDFGALAEGTKIITSNTVESFFGFFQPETLQAYRALPPSYDDLGFPSGHTSGAIALWGGMALIFRKKSLTIFAAVMIILMMISRMYLGKHFIGDVIGGAVIGTLFLALAHTLIQNANLDRLFEKETYSFRVQTKFLAAITLIGFAIPLALFFSGEGLTGRMASLIGLNLAFWLLITTEIDSENGALWQRSLRVILGFAMFFAFNAAVKQLPLPHDGLLYIFAKGFLPAFFLVLAAPYLVSLTLKKT